MRFQFALKDKELPCGDECQLVSYHFQTFNADATDSDSDSLFQDNKIFDTIALTLIKLLSSKE